MKNVIRLGTRLPTALLLTILLASCGAATTPASNDPAPTGQQAARLEQTTPSPAPPTMTSTTTSVQLTPTTAATDEPEPTQTLAPTTAVPAPTPTEHTHEPASGAASQADIKLFQYRPDPLKIALGTTVVWTNKDEAPHTVTHGTYVERGGAFDSGTLKHGQSFSFTFDQAGNYPYTCLIHPEMVGTIKVIGP